MHETFEQQECGPSRRVELERHDALMLPLPTRRVATIAMFSAPTREAKKLLPSPRLVPVELYPGTTLVGFSCAELSELSDLDAHGELSIVVPVRYQPRFSVPLLPIVSPQRFDDAGYYVHRLLTSSAPLHGLGQELQGVRSLLCDVRFDEEPFWRSCTVRADGKLLCALEVRKARTRPRRVSTHLFTLREGNLLRTPLPLHGELGIARGLQSGRLTLGNHYVADELRALKLGDAPLFTLYGPAIESLLAAPDRVVPA
jgi:hypothetical protein